MYLQKTKLWSKNRRKNEKMTIASIPISPFEGFGIKMRRKRRVERRYMKLLTVGLMR